MLYLNIMDSFVPKYTYYLATTLDVCSSHGPLHTYVYFYLHNNWNPNDFK